MGRALQKCMLLALLAALALSGTSASAVTHPSKKRSKPGRFHRFRHRIIWNPLVRGSHDSLLRQNAEIDRLQLPRIENDEQLLDLEAHNELVEISDGEGIRVAPNLEPSRRFCKPWTLAFLQDLGTAYYAEFNSSLQVTSAVRTMEQQKKLRRHNRNAAPIEGDTASSHLAGTTIDLGKRGLTRKQRTWLSNYLKDLGDQGYIEAAEERRQACFHVMVVEKYAERHQPQPSEPASAAPAPSEDGSGPELF